VGSPPLLRVDNGGRSPTSYLLGKKSDAKMHPIHQQRSVVTTKDCPIWVASTAASSPQFLVGRNAAIALKDPFPQYLSANQTILASCACCEDKFCDLIHRCRQICLFSSTIRTTNHTFQTEPHRRWLPILTATFGTALFQQFDIKCLRSLSCPPSVWGTFELIQSHLPLLCPLSHSRN